jgi:hypothetical protein
VLPFVKVDFAQLIFGHQPDQVFDHLGVERPGGVGFILGGHGNPS